MVRTTSLENWRTNVILVSLWHWLLANLNVVGIVFWFDFLLIILLECYHENFLSKTLLVYRSY